ncbi:hypothetical protein CORC01_04182 [Colletotrichum orchidophilum]|uniref:Uncharacterized protein n=1 Tax=Colletotrichum orchidophilum TaxID=1209926 RepID=A0A1G4BG69_9PEZI|nr:uncharacterized protein CORC01_04182 [Colletotrichum orchidophilum]OHF00432.1 hypothetical protein CORC01_04182 [Colletotrichum orchidophilum]
MALWPFRRRSGRKRSRSGANLSDVEAPPQASQARGFTTGETTAPRAAMPKKQRLEKQQPPPRRERTYSFSPGRNDSIRVAGQKGSVPLEPGRSTGLFPADRNDGEEKGDPAWQRVPTLHNARHGQPSRSSRRKTSKRRREETDREAEIKAMTNFAPVRPAADPWTSGRPIGKQSKRLKTGLGFRRSLENPQSDVSLPMSIHSSMSSDTELHSFRVSALEALAPRPTLRYAVYPRWGPGHGSAPSRTQQQKRKVSERVPESVVRAHKRVDSFADDLDAADLRELMERDNRRRERKRQRDQERIERRLARRSEKQREAVAEASHSGSPPPVNLERGVLGREVGLGIDAASAIVTSSRRRSWSSSRHSRKISTVKDAQPEAEPELQPQPQPETETMETETMDIEPEPAAVHHFHRTTSIPPEAPPSPTLPAQPVPERKTSTKLTPKGSMRLKRSFLRRISRSRSPNATESDQHAISQYSSRQDEGETPRKVSRARISFSALFRLGKRNRRNSGPSSFSNTSRETMQASAAAAAAQAYSQSQTYVPQPQEEAAAPVQVPMPPMPPIPPPVNYIPRKVSNGVPKRTRSRFREDLPELPLSPPDSRVGSPEVEMPLPVVSESRSGENTLQNTPAVRYDTPTSDLRRADEKMEKLEKLEKMRQTPTSLRHSIQPSPEPVSLASIDSEGSWLSGRVGARRSSGMRGSMQRLPPQNTSHPISPNDTEEDLADDEYLSSLATPSREMLAEERTPRKSTGDAFPSSDEDEMMKDADMKWGSVDRQHATVVQHQRVKSREGMLNSYQEDSTSPEGSEGETPKLQRATSVSLSRGNARHVSSGSTKMLEVSPRASADHRRSTDAVF